MLKLLIICVVALANGTRGQSDRIVGGSIAENNQFPHQASIRNRVDMQHLCGAAIITRKYLVTAASCVQFNFSKPDNILVVVGTRLNDLSGIFHSLKTIVPHPRFSDSTWQNDIALLNTENEIIFSDQVGPIQLPTQDPPPSGELPVVISGWGQFSYPLESSTDVISPVLRFLQTTTLSRGDCIRRHGHNSRLIHTTSICTNNEKSGACVGDYGGPLIDPEQNVLVGIASWVIPCARGFPDVYQRVFPHVPWINLYLEHDDVM